MTTRTYSHYSKVKPEDWPWKNFTPEEMACSGTGKLKVNSKAMDALQALRDLLGPLVVNSAYRSPEYNRTLRGAATNSLHLRGIAFDISMNGHNRREFEAAARAVGFTGFGFYNSFMHIDTGRAREWGTRITPVIQPTADRNTWGGLFTSGTTPEQKLGLARIITYGLEWGYTTEQIAYVLATVYHETAKWMEPIREGAMRYGPAYTDASSRKAVASIYAKGIISRNYALPDGPHGHSYYGRGLVQITLLTNYEKFEDILGIPLVEYPDLALEWDHALDCLYLGLRDGIYTGKKLRDYQFPADYRAARAMVNADVSKNGEKIAEYARTFLYLLQEG